MVILKLPHTGSEQVCIYSNVLHAMRLDDVWLFHSLPLPGRPSAFGDVFSVIGVREPQAAASEAFVKFAEAHRNMEKYGIQLLKTIKPVSSRRN